MATKALFQETVKKVMGSVWFYKASYYPIPGLNLALRNSKWAEAFKPSAICSFHDKITITKDVAEGTLIKFSSTGLLPAPLNDTTDYYAIRVDATHIKVAASLADAVLGEAIDLTTIGTGVHTIQLPIPDGFGTGTEEDPWRIWDFDDLCAWRAEANVLIGWVEICDDIDASDSEELNEGAGWLPVGTYDPDTPFIGFFDGNNHTISNLFINRFGEGYNGLFGITLGATIQNLGLGDADIISYYYGGVLCGWNDVSSIITNCYTTGKIIQNEEGYAGGLCGINKGSINHCYSTCEVMGYYDVGGLVGVNNTGSITNCCTNGEVTSYYDVGGLCGRNTHGSVMNCYAIGVLNFPSGGIYFGGLCGTNYYGKIINCFSTSALNLIYSGQFIGGLCGENDYGSKIINCYAAGAVTAGVGSSFVGGLCGANSGGSEITNCCATGAVTAGDSSSVGGLCGSQFESKIKRCYATGAVTGRDMVGGLIGLNQDSTDLKNCYATGAVTGETYVGGLCGLLGGIQSAPAALVNCYSIGLVICTIGDWTANAEVEGGDLVRPVIKNGLYYRCMGTGTTGSSEPVWPTAPGEYVNDGTTLWYSGMGEGGLCGAREGNPPLENEYAVVTSCYYDSETSGQSDTGKGEPKTTEEMKKKATFVDWDFKYTCRNDEIYKISYDTGTTKPIIGGKLNIVGIHADSCFVKSYTLTGGSWAEGDAAGILSVYRCSDSFITNFASGNDLENDLNELICNSTSEKTLDVDNSTYPALFSGFRVLTVDGIFLTLSIIGNGTITTPGTGIYKYELNESASIIAEAAEHSHFDNWTGSAVTAGKVTDPNAANTNVTMDDSYTLTANFSIDKKTLTIYKSGEGEVLNPGEGEFEYNYGTSVPILADLGADYWDWDCWTGTAVDAGKVLAPYQRETEVFVDDNYTLIANFVPHS